MGLRSDGDAVIAACCAACRLSAQVSSSGEPIGVARLSSPTASGLARSVWCAHGGFDDHVSTFKRSRCSVSLEKPFHAQLVGHPLVVKAAAAAAHNQRKFDTTIAATCRRMRAAGCQTSQGCWS